MTFILNCIKIPELLRASTIIYYNGIVFEWCMILIIAIDIMLILNKNLS